MEIIVKIPEDFMENIDELNNKFDAIKEAFYGSMAIIAIQSGKPLPKGHGRLIDADEVIKIANKTKDLHGAIWNAPTIIEADKENKQ